MPLMTHEPPGAAPKVRKLGLRVHPALVLALKIAAATEGRSMESKLHDMLCRELDRADLLAPSESTTRG